MGKNIKNQLAYLDNFTMTHVSHIDAVNVYQDVSFLEVLAARPVQDGFHLLAVGAVGDREPETHSTFGNLHREEFHLVGG